MKNAQQNIGLLILRLTIGGLMLFHGYDYLIHGIDSIISLFREIGLPGFMAYTVYLGELIAPLMLIIGYRTRLASLFIAATMVVAIILVHSNDIFKLGEYGNWALELNGLYLFGSLAILFLGGGKIGLSSSNKWD
jgi:putative oxidoreductase